MVIVVIIIFVDVVVCVRVIGATVFVSRVILSNISLFSLFISTSDTNFCYVLIFYSAGTLVRVCRRSCLWLVSSQRLFAAHQGFPNHSALFLRLGVLQSVHVCHSPNGPDLLISSVVAFMNCWMMASAVVPNAFLASF